MLLTNTIFYIGKREPHRGKNPVFRAENCNDVLNLESVKIVLLHRTIFFTIISQKRMTSEY